MQLKGNPNIERAWQGFRDTVLVNATAEQRKEMRLAFFAGAAVLFYSIMAGLDPGEEPTEADMARMDAIHEEIDRFTRTFDEEVLKRNPHAMGRA